MTPFCKAWCWRTGAFALALTLVSGAVSPLYAGVITTGDCLPPVDPNDAYLGLYHRYEGGIGTLVLASSSHSSFVSCASPPAFGTTTDTFGSTVSGDLFLNGVFFGAFSSSATTTVDVTFAGMLGPTRFFDTEMLQLDISGGGLMIRESPTLHSTGKTTITDLGAGRFLIDSFFDVFTELSLDGGQTWIPSSGPGPGGSTTMTLTTVPEPMSLLLVATGLGVGCTRMRRRKSDAASRA
jgi:hypothetical protein